MSNNLEQIKQRAILIQDLTKQAKQLAQVQFTHEAELGTQKSSRLNLIDEIASCIDNINSALSQIAEDIELLDELESDVPAMEGVKFSGNLNSQAKEDTA